MSESGAPQSNEKSNAGSTEKALAWYSKAPGAKLTAEARELFVKYGGVPAEDVERHICDVRDRAWKVLPYPCIGLFTFLHFTLARHPSYGRVLELLRPASQKLNSTESTSTDIQNPPRFLDLACCFGQDIRKLVHDGIPPSVVYGTDIEKEYLDLGFELFGDRDKFPDPDSQFFAADLFAADAANNSDPGTEAAASVWREHEGKFAVIQAGNFLHLFDYDTQLRACCLIARLLDPNPGSMIVGGQMGSSNPREISRTGILLEVPASKKTGEGDAQEGTVKITAKYWHSPSTFRQMWTEVGERTGTKWDIEARFIGASEIAVSWERKQLEGVLQRLGGPYNQEDVRYLTFTVTRVA
ncbi:hypothetical protein VTN00DRAFT_196 [Thermoascus crustaceus]|uniref:uncharacterized protein n=1 Tax=Thermoascus crustaceus TaxID=5088 RepID=UPI0037448970